MLVIVLFLLLNNFIECCWGSLRLNRLLLSLLLLLLILLVEVHMVVMVANMVIFKFREVQTFELHPGVHFFRQISASLHESIQDLQKLVFLLQNKILVLLDVLFHLDPVFLIVLVVLDLLLKKCI